MNDIEYLIQEVEKGGEVRITTYNQKSGPYISVSGLGVNAGGYKTVAEALSAWRKAKKELDISYALSAI